jgi:hypothetical protein
MDQNYSDLLKLLSHELFGALLPSLVPADNLHGVLELAQKHTVTTLLYRSVKQLSNVSAQVLDSLRTQSVAAVLRNEKLMLVQNEIVDLLSGHHIDFAVLKGSSLAVHYPCCEMRVLGDIDILVNVNALGVACATLEKAGYNHSSGHAFHESYEGKGAHIEIHQSVSEFPHTVAGLFTVQVMKNALDTTEVEKMLGYEFPVLCVEYQLIALLAHMERHLTASGIGLRQLCDWAVTVNHYRERITREVVSIVGRCGLLQFAKVLTKTCSIYLGMSELEWTKDVSVVLARRMMEEILSGGSIMNVDIDRSLSSAFSSGKIEKERTILGNYIANINRKAKSEYPIVQKFPLLFPYFLIFFPLRWFLRSLRGEREKISIKSTLSLGSKRKRLYDELRLFRCMSDDDANAVDPRS